MSDVVHLVRVAPRTQGKTVIELDEIDSEDDYKEEKRENTSVKPRKVVPPVERRAFQGTLLSGA